MVKILTEKGVMTVPDDIKVENLNIQKPKIVHPSVPENIPDKHIPIYSAQERKKEIKTFNKDPEIRANGLLLVKKSSFFLVVGLLSVLIVMITVGMIWFNVSVGKIADKSFSDGPITVEGSNTQVNATVLNDHQINNYINVTVNIPNQMIVNLNNTNSSV